MLRNPEQRVSYRKDSQKQKSGTCLFDCYPVDSGLDGRKPERKKAPLRARKKLPNTQLTSSLKLGFGGQHLADLLSFRPRHGVYPAQPEVAFCKRGQTHIVSGVQLRVVGSAAQLAVQFAVKNGEIIRRVDAVDERMKNRFFVFIDLQT